MEKVDAISVFFPAQNDIEQVVPDRTLDDVN